MTIKIGDTAPGILSVSVGGGGLTMQAVMDGMSLALLTLNILLALGGLMFLGYRVIRARRKTRSQRWDDS